jgi:hypothetical protein
MKTCRSVGHLRLCEEVGHAESNYQHPFMFSGGPHRVQLGGYAHLQRLVTLPSIGGQAYLQRSFRRMALRFP